MLFEVLGLPPQNRVGADCVCVCVCVCVEGPVGPTSDDQPIILRTEVILLSSDDRLQPPRRSKKPPLECEHYVVGEASLRVDGARSGRRRWPVR